MSDAFAVRIPRENVNDDVVTLARWHVAAGERVRAGAPLFDMETSKAVLQVDAEREGFVEPLVAEGDEIAVGAEVCRLHDSPVAARALPGGGGVGGAHAAPADAARGERTAVGNGPAISRKARAIMEERGLDPSLFSHLPQVREADVIRHLEEAERRRADGARGAEKGGPSAVGGGWMKDASVAARERGHGVVWLALNYFFRNYLLGHLATFAPRGLILVVHRMRGVKIGRDCFIDPTSILETAYPENITIGNDVRVTARVAIMTHIKAPHYLRDTGIVPNVLKPVRLDDHSFIGVNAVIMPGVTVGRAAVVASGAVVVADVPPFTMVAGNPARVIRRFPRPAGESGPPARTPSSTPTPADTP